MCLASPAWRAYEAVVQPPAVASAHTRPLLQSHKDDLCAAHNTGRWRGGPNQRFHHQPAAICRSRRFTRDLRVGQYIGRQFERLVHGEPPLRPISHERQGAGVPPTADARRVCCKWCERERAHCLLALFGISEESPPASLRQEVSGFPEGTAPPYGPSVRSQKSRN